MVFVGAALMALALLVVLFLVFPTRAVRIPLSRRRPVQAETTSALASVTSALSTWLTSLIRRRGWGSGFASALEQAGIKRSASEFVILVGSVALVGMLLGYLVGGIGLGIVSLVIVPIGARLRLTFRAGRRRKAFANQLDETLQILAGGLRAGHSLLRAIDAVSRESDAPTSEEFARIVNETRLGRDLNDALEGSAQRMRSDDFNWVAQAIAIHREVGGDLSRVLDEVGHTIRERGQIRRQVQALSAEGKMSAYILLALPFVVIGILMMTSPSYILKFVQSPLGFVLMFAAAVMMTIGTVWLQKVVKIKF
ncbi:type II secretion system F family protein [Curtobacterium ammoniigenes]|uniref:type II secretion system F family protein n=1 Tax=Curtobacterium ammoniigenes TaxID=395387 RepID=UPI00083713D4|nr:type II secretion system F family protein [Curtobacterium ammoniigenes]